GLQLGNCFFGQNLAFAVKWLAWGPPTVLAKIVIDYTDGTSEVIATDKNWRAETGPILFDNIYAGETYDAQRERPRWSAPGYNDATWQPAAEVKSPTARLQAQMIPPIRRIRELPVQRVIDAGNGRWLLDFGQNIAGWVRLRVKEKAGATVRLRLAEVLSPDEKHVDMATTGVGATGVEQQQIYISKGRGWETWEPRFAYHGFRFAEITGVSGRPDPKDFTAVHVRTAVETRGNFRCSDELLNRIYRTSLWTIENNLHGTAEDCPHREKCGWLGDAHSVAETTIYNFDMAQFWTKFVDDIATVLGRGEQTAWGQKATPGIACNVAVGRRLCGEAQPDWGSAYVLLPWYLYTYYGDTDVFTRHYQHLKRWITYVGGLTENHIVTRGYGDWYPPGGNTNMKCPVPLTSTAYYYGTLRIMEQIAGLLGKVDDTAAFARQATVVKAAFLKRFFDPVTRSYGSQTANAVALRFGLFPDGQDEDVARALAREVSERHQGHAFVGIHGGRPLYSTLSDYGFDNVAFAAMRKKDWPSFAFLFEHGFTTWPEVFHQFTRSKPKGADSLNHLMQSGFAVWFHESVGGIRPAAPGFKQIELTPHGIDQLAWAETDYNSPYGLIRSHWRRRGKAFTWKISVPANTTATVKVPARNADTVTESNQPAGRARGVKFLRFENGRAVYTVGGGTYVFNARQ
ncbi:MAG: family 78 glycoside hydrolase catalytic domain, partial [Candidatus Binatia bacterium]